MNHAEFGGRHRLVLAGFLIASVLWGCRDAAKHGPFASLGLYDSPPVGISRPKTVVMPFQFRIPDVDPALEEAAAEDLASLLKRADRFDVLDAEERDRLLNPPEVTKVEDLFKEAVRIELLFYGRVTELEATVADPPTGPSGDLLVRTVARTEIVVADPETGKILVKGSEPFYWSGPIGDLGLRAPPPGTRAGARLPLDREEQRMLLRLSSDQALKGILPEIDRHLVEKSSEPQPIEHPDRRYCTNCGHKLDGEAVSCPSCGGKLDAPDAPR
jgi:hypothetical protein